MSVACPGCGLEVLPPAGAPLVACPRCGTAFAVAGPLPTAELVGYRHPLAPPEETPPPPATPRTLKSGLGVLFVLALFAAAGGLYYWEFHVRPKPVPEPLPIDDIVFTPTGSGQTVRSNHYNFRFALPASDWTPDAEARKRLPGSLFALRRSAPAAGLAIWVKDFQTHTPRHSMVLDEGIARLNKGFHGLSFTPQPDTELAGHKAMRLTFQANGPVHGECYLLAHHGIAYGLVAWAEQPDDLAALWKGFEILDLRQDWAEQRAKAQVLHGSKLPYTLQDPYAIWTRDANFQGYTGADLAVLARDPVAPRYLSNAATVIVLLPAAAATLDDAVTHARQHLEKVQGKDHPDTRVSLLPGQDVRLNIGTFKGLVSKFHVHSGDSRQRFVVQAVFHRADAVVVVQCECPWPRRTFWERDFDEIVRTFRME